MAERISLAKAFQMRPARFRLLDKGVWRTGWEKRPLSLLEAGCSAGDAAAHLAGERGFKVTAFDLDPGLIGEAVRTHGQSENLQFDVADSAALPYQDAVFDGLVSEAAFSPMPDKRAALKEYHRVLKKGSIVLMNDFFIKQDAGEEIRQEVVHIPCFAGVQTRECYEALFEDAGFSCAGFFEEYGELLGLTAWLCRVYQVKPDMIGGYLSRYFHSGASKGASCETDVSHEGGKTFFKRSDLSFCQMIFRCE